MRIEGLDPAHQQDVHGLVHSSRLVQGAYALLEASCFALLQS